MRHRHHQITRDGEVHEQLGPRRVRARSHDKATFRYPQGGPLEGEPRAHDQVHPGDQADVPGAPHNGHGVGEVRPADARHVRDVEFVKGKISG